MQFVYYLVNKSKREGSERNIYDVDRSLTSTFAVKLDRSDKDDEMCYGYEPTGTLIIRGA